MQNCQFYYLTDAYYADFPDPFLMRGSKSVGGNVHHRPFFFAFPDPQQPKVFWLVPVSSKYKKYRAIYKKEVAKYGRCRSLVFGKLEKRMATFLLQNICPVTEEYLVPYVDRQGNPVSIDGSLAQKVRSGAMLIIALARQGIKIIFPKSLQIYKKLLKKIEAEEKAKEKKKAQAIGNQSKDQGQVNQEGQDVIPSIEAPTSLPGSPKGGEGQS